MDYMDEYNYKGMIVRLDRIPAKLKHRHKPYYKCLPSGAEAVSQYTKIGRLVLKLPRDILIGETKKEDVRDKLASTLSMFVLKHFSLGLLEFCKILCPSKDLSSRNYYSDPEILDRLLGLQKIVFIAYTGNFQTVDIPIEEFDEENQLRGKIFGTVHDIQAFLPIARETMNEAIAIIEAEEEDKNELLMKEAKKRYEAEMAKYQTKAIKTKTKTSNPEVTRTKAKTSTPEVIRTKTVDDIPEVKDTNVT